MCQPGRPGPHDVFLLVFVALHTDAWAKFVEIQVRELAVFGKLAEPEIQRLVLGLIRDFLLHQHPDHLDHLRHVIRRRGKVLRTLHAQRAEILEERVLKFLREVREPHAELPAAADRLVVHIGEIHHALHVEAARFEMPLQQILEDIRAKIPDVREVIDRRPAGVELHAFPRGIERAELFQFAGVGVEKSRRHEPATVAAAGNGAQHRSRFASLLRARLESRCANS